MVTILFLQFYLKDIFGIQMYALDTLAHMRFLPLAAASTINKEQEQARGETASAYKTLEGVHITLHYQFLEMKKHREDLKQRFFCIHEQAPAMSDRPRSRSEVMTTHQATSREPSGLSMSRQPEVQTTTRATWAEDT